MKMIRCWALLFLAGMTAGAQAPLGPKKLQFDVAIVKPSANTLPARSPMGWDNGVAPGRVYFPGSTLAQIISVAYGLDRGNFDVAPWFSGPDWIKHESFLIDGRTSSQSKAEILEMLRNLLADRFHLEVRWDTQKGAGYELRAINGGPKPQSTEVDGSNHFYGMRTMPEIVAVISGVVNNPVADLTGMQGTFLLDLNPPGGFCSAYYPFWRGSPAQLRTCDGSKPLFAELLRKNMNLTITERNQVSFKTLTIAHVDRPSEQAQ